MGYGHGMEWKGEGWALLLGTGLDAGRSYLLFFIYISIYIHYAAVCYARFGRRERFGGIIYNISGL